MAYSPKLFSFLFLVALVSLPLALQAVHAAREGQQYFAKASPTTTTTTSTFPEEEQEEPDSTAFRSKAHQLYSNNDNSYYYPTNTQEATYKHHPTAFASDTKSVYETNNYQEPATYKPTGVATRSKVTANHPTTDTKDLYSLSADELANYYSIDNTALNKNHQNSKAATAGQENSSIDNYYNEYRFGTGNKKRSGDQQQATRQMGMSDTRFLGNGKYFYDINKDKTRNVNGVHVGSARGVYNQETYNPTATTKGRAWGNRNSQALAKDDDDEGDEISP